MADLHLTATPAIMDPPVEIGATRLAAVEFEGVHTMVLRPDDPGALAEDFQRHVAPLPAIGQSGTTPAGDRVLRPTRERAYLIGPSPDTSRAATLFSLDQSGFWAAIELSGPGARAVLERSWRPDLGDGSFATGSVTRSSIGQIPTILARIDGQTYLLLAPRSYARSLFHNLATSLSWVL